MQTGKAALETIRTSPVMEIPVLNKLKRRRTDSPEPFSPHRMQPNKKARSEAEPLQQQPRTNARFPAKPEPEHVFTQVPSMAIPTSAVHQLYKVQNNERSLARVDSATTLRADMDVKYATNGTTATTSPNPEDAVMQDAQISLVEDFAGLTPLQQVIENEFNMQILMKHNELRLIDQELAKCQIALEQLRRCELRPYPGAEQLSATVSAGTGASIVPPAGHTRPTHPAAHGVTDGPYTRHYRQWLLHDTMFDSVPSHAGMPTDNGAYGGVRSTRGNGSARKSVQKSSSAPGRSVDSLHSLPNYPPPAAKDKSAPLILRRSTDGQLVKLICNDCQRGNFSSIQGFLNHCRIAHKVDYKSHDAAAVDCGRLLDENEAANLPPEAHAIPVHKPSTSRSSSTTTTPFKTQNLVHPMNTVCAASMHQSASQQPRLAHSSKPTPVSSLAAAASSMPNSSPFTASSQAPRLSAHFAKFQLGGNLEQAIATAKQKVDFGADDDAASPDVLDSASPATPVAGSRTVFGGGRAGSLAPPGAVSRPPSRKGHREPAQRHRPSPLAAAPARMLLAQRQEHGEIPESPQDHHSSNLSPHTADSNPGLVSDHEDDDHGSASEDEVPQATIAHSLGVRSRGCADDMDIDVAVEDDLDQHSVVIRRNSMLGGADRGLRTASGTSRKLGMSSKGA